MLFNQGDCPKKNILFATDSSHGSLTHPNFALYEKLGLTPNEQVDFAYLVYNLGLDVFYFANQVFIARQVVTNSKGEKVEVLWSTQAYEDLAMMNVGFAPVEEFVGKFSFWVD